MYRYVSANGACGDCGVATKKRYLEILEFTHFCRFYSFDKIGDNHKEKNLIHKISVVVAFEVETVDTKNDIQKTKDSVLSSEEAEDGI